MAARAGDYGGQEQLPCGAGKTEVAAPFHRPDEMRTLRAQLRRRRREQRFLCAGRREAGICDNHRTISARILEQCTLGAIENELLDDRVVAEVVRE